MTHFKQRLGTLGMVDALQTTLEIGVGDTGDGRHTSNKIVDTHQIILEIGVGDTGDG